MSSGRRLSPRWTRRLLAAVVRDRDGRNLIDDLDELFADDVAAGVPMSIARRRFRREALTLAVRWWLHRSARSAGTSGNARPSFEIVRQLRLATRRLVREPLFSATVVVTLALGIGGNAVLLSLYDSLWFDPLPFPTAERLVHVWSAGERGSRTPISYPNIEDISVRWNEQTDSSD